MVSPAGGFAQGLERGWRLGDSAERSRFAREDRERLNRERDREERVRAAVGAAFADPGAGAAPMAAAPAMPPTSVSPVSPRAAGGLTTAAGAGLGATPAQGGAAPAAPQAGLMPRQQPQSPDYVSQLNGTLSRLFAAAADPKNADIAPDLYDKAGIIAQSTKRFGDVMLQQARQKAMPHIKTLYAPNASDEQKSAALGALMNDVFPDGGQYQPRVVGGEIQLFDGAGKPVMDEKGKPRTMSMEEVDQMLTYGLSDAESYITSVQESIKQRRELTLKQAERDEERAYKERREDEKYRRERQDELNDRGYTESRALEKETREEKRAAIKAKRDFIAKAMAAYDKDAASGMADPKGRAQYLAQIRATADEQFGGGSGPANPQPVQPQPGDAIEVDVGLGAPAPAAAPAVKPAAAAPPPVPVPGGAAPLAPQPGLMPRGEGGDVSAMAFRGTGAIPQEAQMAPYLQAVAGMNDAALESMLDPGTLKALQSVKAANPQAYRRGLEQQAAKVIATKKGF